MVSLDVLGYFASIICRLLENRKENVQNTLLGVYFGANFCSGDVCKIGLSPTEGHK